MAYTPTLKKLQVTPAVVQLLQKHGYYASGNILSGVDSLPVIVIEQPHDISTKACETFDLTTNTPDARQNLDVAQYVEACARFAGCESRWSPFDAQLFAAVQDDPGVSVILERLDDPQFARALQRFLHQTVAYFQATGNILPLHDAGRVAFKRDMRGHYDYTVQHSPEDQARLFYPADSYDSYLWNTRWHASMRGHHKFLARTNHLRFIHGLLAATASPYYRLTDQPPLWPNKQFQNTRRQWERIYNFTRRLANGPPPDVDTYGSTIL